MASEYLFTSESVSEGHPDKVADQISDAVLDACLEQDPMSRVAAETLCTTGLVVLAGEITTGANVDYIGLTRDVLKRIGYDNTEYGIDHKGCSVLVGYDKQSQDIAQGVDSAADDELNLGAGDQGLMFGYACDETPTLMPAPIYYAHRLMERQSIVRRNGIYDQVVKALEGRDWVEFWGIEPNPSVETVREAIALGREHGSEFLLAVGGGSVIDGTKLIAAGLLYDGDAWDIVLKGQAGKTVPPALAAPLYVRDRVALTSEERRRGEKL